MDSTCTNSKLVKAKKILEDWPRFGGHPLVLRRWSDNLDLQKVDMKTIPIWVKFPNLKLSCRSVNFKNFLLHWKPNMHGQVYFNRSKVGLCKGSSWTSAEVSTDSNLPDSIIIGCKDNTLEQAVEYVWKLWKPIVLSEMQNIHSLIKKLPTSS